MAVEYGKWQKIEREDSKKNPPAGIFFIKGWWTNHRDESIKRAIYGQKLRFHIQMNKNFAQVGDIVYFGLYDCDRFAFGKDTVKKDDDHIPLEYKETKKPYEWAKVDKDYKVVLEFRLTTELMADWSKVDQDGVFELYFRCSYNNRGKKEHCALPFNREDYLRLGTIVIDRYKIPGLNPKGTGIAEDMAYGFGYANPNKQIYTDGEISQYIKEYTERGFDINSHYQFANIENESEGVTVVGKRKDKKTLKEIISDYSYSIQELIERTNKKAIYSIKEIEDLGKLTKMTSKEKDEDYLWGDFRFLKFFLVWGELSPILDEMIDKFQRNEGGIFENMTLTKAVKENPNTLEYCQKVENYIAEQLKNNFCKLEDAEDKEPYFENKVEKNIYNSKNDRKDTKKNFNRPAYSYWDSNNLADNLISGKTLALNDIWATEIILKEVNFEDDTNYNVKYNVILWDHFGLDYPDLEKFYSYGAGFRAWFVLQHLRGYKPFITKITFEKEFIGNLQQGKSEREEQQKIEKRHRIDKWVEEEQQKMWRSPKF